MSKSKKVKGAAEAPKTLKKVPDCRMSCPMSDPNNMRPSWRFGRVHGSGESSYGFPDDEKTKAEILDFLRSIESQTVGELRQTNKYAIYSLADSSVKDHLDDWVVREMSLKFEDVYELHRFRMTGKQRLFAISVEPGVFELTWWDPKHKIYPVKKRHT